MAPELPLDESRRILVDSVDTVWWWWWLVLSRPDGGSSHLLVCLLRSAVIQGRFAPDAVIHVHKVPRSVLFTRSRAGMRVLINICATRNVQMAILLAYLPPPGQH